MQIENITKVMQNMIDLCKPNLLKWIYKAIGNERKSKFANKM